MNQDVERSEASIEGTGTMNRLAIIGAGDLGQQIAHHATGGGRFEVAGFFDDFKSEGAETEHGVVLGSVDETETLYRDRRFDLLIIGIGYKHFSYRRACFERFSPCIPFATLVHPSSYVDPSARVNDGSVLFPGCALDKGVIIKANTLLNAGCTIAHDTNVGENCFLGPGVTLAGFVTIDSDCFLGVGTTVIDGVTICRNVQTGGGAVVVKDIDEPGLYVGVPAKIVHRHEPHKIGDRNLWASSR